MAEDARVAVPGLLPFDPFGDGPGAGWAGAQLQAAGLRVTALRVGALRLLAGRRRRWTEAEVFDELRSAMPISARGSVNRTLVMLNAAGLTCREFDDPSAESSPQRWALHTGECLGCELAPTCPPARD